MPDLVPIPGRPRYSTNRPPQMCAACEEDDHDKCTDRDERANGVPDAVLDIKVAWRCKCRKRRHQN